MSIPRPEHPRPRFMRESWQNLNGPWQFAVGEEAASIADPFPRTITVPFCPEAALSGVGITDFMKLVWYKRTFTLPPVTGRVLLHFGAVDYAAAVYINGQPAGTHRGGYSSFSFDITSLVKEGENQVALRVEDDLWSGRQPRGKQCPHRESRGCDYTRTTGVWQTVWLEFVPAVYLRSVRQQPDWQAGSLTFTTRIAGGDPAGLTLRVTLWEGEREAARYEGPAALCNVFTLRPDSPRLWDPADPFLYGVTYELLRQGETADRVTGYAGIRGVELKNGCLHINGRPVFQRLVLDQGFYPEGIYTAPTEEDLIRDITLSLDLGFNGARLHQKVFEERFLYHCDRLGYLVWGEQGNWGLNYDDPSVLGPFLQEWLEVVERDFDHPALIGWCPFNEVNKGDGPIENGDILRTVYLTTKALDPTRPVIDVSGFFHLYPTDLYDTHDYDQDVAHFKEKYAAVREAGAVDPHWYGQQYDGALPLFVSEYGGARYSLAEGNGWGYGDAPADAAAFADRYVGLTETLLQNPRICGFCYTQLYDIEQEQNGLYTYPRGRKFPPEIYDRIRECNTQKAAIE